ncbi:MAG TPA: protein tyrosine phosphatase family protein [Mucilaginibacter sp.]|jgi:protein tyrosine phosphatase (PTP) superfamily phosphohydrolase (DUF442 family)
MSSIYNFHKVSDLLACAGQPREGQLASLADEDYKVVINLGLADGRYALKDEAASVKALGMAYYHIPVIFDEPKTEELTSFISLMKKCADEKTFVHCAANYRASAFVGLYLFAINKLNEDEMEDFIDNIWRPEPIWESFIEDSVDFLNSATE